MSSSPAAISDFWRRLHEAPWEHDFFHALRRLENLHRDRPRLGTARRPQDEALRLVAEGVTTPAEVLRSIYLTGGAR